MSGHTATPWETRAGHVYSTAGNVCSVSEPHASRFVGYTELEIGSPHANEAYANAAFIVTACNSHADLVKALQFYASEWQPNGEGDPETPGLSRSWVEPTDELQNDGGRKARAALATLTARKVG